MGGESIVENPFLDEEVCRTEKYRWFVLMQLSFVVISSAYVMMTFSPVSKIISTIYNVGDLVVNTCVMSFLIAFVIFNFMSVSVLEKYGIYGPVSKPVLLTLSLVQTVYGYPDWRSLGSLLCTFDRRQFLSASGRPVFDCNRAALFHERCE